MNTHDLQAEIAIIDQEIAPLENGVPLAVVKKLLNLLERVAGDNASLEKELQELRDEINRLKGEQGKPDIKANKKKDGDISSEAERKEAEAQANGDTEGDQTDGKKKRRREPKLPNVKIDREQICRLDTACLPDDLEFRGYEDVVVQNLVIKTDNVKYRREVYYSPSQHKTYLGALPDGVQGEFGPGLRALIPILKTEGGLSEKRLLGFFQNFGLVISPAYLSQQWTGGYGLFHPEKSALYRAGLAASDYAQIDDTSAREGGINQYCQIVCNPWFTAYFTTPAKDRRTVLDVLTDFAPRHYLYNSEAQTLLHGFKLSAKAQSAVEAVLTVDGVMDETQFAAHAAGLHALGPRHLDHLAEACAIAYYRQQPDFPVIHTLLADDAPQFKLLTQHRGLCWVHDGRLYAKLTPLVPSHQGALADFRGRYWSYYTELRKYQREPSPERKAGLSKEFDTLFSTATGYEALDDRIAKTLGKKTELLRVLDLPQLPLHNNDAELAARVQARFRDVSYQTRSAAGTKIKDTFMTINQTAKKLGVSFYDYVYDRVSGRFEMPSLAELITQRAMAAVG